MSIYSGNTFDVVGKKLKGVQVTFTAPPSTTKLSTITNDNGEWQIEVNDVDNSKAKLTFTQDGKVIATIPAPLPTGKIERINSQSGGTLNLKGKYGAGKYYITSLEVTTKEDIDKQLAEAYKFVKANPGNYKLYIESSESRVTNYDREPSSPTNGKPLLPTEKDPAPLARRRAEALQKYANDFFLNNYNKENPVPTGFILPEVQIRSVITGSTKYDSQTDTNPYDGPKGENYKNEQYTKLIADFISKPKCDFITISDKANIAAGGFITFTSSGESYIEFDPAVAPDLFIIETTKNGIISITRSPTFYQKSGSPGNPITWGIIAFIANSKNKETKVSLEYTKAITLPEVVDIIMFDYAYVPTIKNNIDDILYAEYINKGNFVSDDTRTQLLDYLKKDGGYQTYYYVIKKENYKFDLLTNGVNAGDKFKVKAVNGSYSGGSNYNYKMCK